MLEKTIGSFLLLIGLLIIGWSLYSSFDIFVRESKAPQIFKVQEATDEEISSNLPESEKIQQQMQETIDEKFEEILPSNYLPKLFNLISWSIFAGILIFGGAKIASLGISLIKRQ